MSIDYDAFTREEKDNFIKFLLSEKEMKAAVFLASARSGREASPDEIFEFCFRLAVSKSKQLRKAIAKERDKGKKG